MKYTPKSEEELEKEKQDAMNASLMPNGEYDFDVVETSDAPSKTTGNEMITLKLHVFDNEGNARIIFDYLTAAMGYKLRHAADACGLISAYEAGNLVASSFDGRAGKVKIKTQKGNKDHPNPKNVVDDYVKRAYQATESVATGAIPINDEIPF